MTSSHTSIASNLSTQMNSKIGNLATSAWQQILVFTRALLFSNGRSLQTQKFVLLPCQIPNF